MFGSITTELVAAAELLVVPSYEAIGNLEIQIPNLLRFITSQNKKNEIVVVQMPSFNLQELLANFLDPKVLIQQLNKGLKFLSSKLVGPSSVLNKIPVKWLKDKIIKIFRSTGNFIEAFRVKVVEGLLNVLEQFDELDFRKAVRNKLNELLGPIGILRAPVTCTNCTSSTPQSFQKALDDGLEWTIPLGQTKEFPLGDLDFGFGPLPIKLQFESAFELSWDLSITFGFQKERGFYLKRRGEGLPDMAVSAGLAVRNFKAVGKLFFLTLSVQDYRDRLVACRCNNDCTDDPAPVTDGQLAACNLSPGSRAFLDKRIVDLSLSVYLIPNRTDPYLTLKTLRSGKSSLLAVEAEASLQTMLAIKASAGEKLPSFEMVLHASLSYTKTFGTGAKGGEFVFNLQFIYPHMDIGKFLTSSIMPVLDAVSSKLSPIVKPLKSLTKEQKVLTTIMGRPSSMLDFLVEMATMMGGDSGAAEKAKSVKKLIEVVVEIDDMIQQITTLAGDTECFALGYVYNFVRKPNGTGFQRVNQEDLAVVFPQQQGLQELFQDVAQSLMDACAAQQRRSRRSRGRRATCCGPGGGVTCAGVGVECSLGEKAKEVMEAIKNSKYFNVPLLKNPALALGLLAGKTLDIVEFTSPKAEFGVDFSMYVFSLVCDPHLMALLIAVAVPTTCRTEEPNAYLPSCGKYQNK